jgi:hypothetical protein
MNLREGTRRLALLLGVIGAMVGGVASYLELQPILDQMARHKSFERLANSDVVKQVRKAIQVPGFGPPENPPPAFNPNLPYEAVASDPIQEFMALPLEQQLSTLQQLSPDKQDKLLAKVKEYRSKQTAPAERMRVPQLGPMPDQMTLEEFGQRIKAKYPQYANLSDADIANKVIAKYPQYKAFIKAASGNKYEIVDPDDWKVIADEVDRGGIKTIHWTKDYGIESIDTEDGQTLYPTPAPSAWRYLLIVLFPILGFFIPWGAVRAIGWVGAGFIQGSK